MKKGILFFALMLFVSVVFSQTSLPLDFENGPYTFTDFDGGVTTVITNPQSSGINTSANVAQQVRNGGQTWAGSYILLDAALDFTTNNAFTMKVWSPAVGTDVKLKIESADHNSSAERDVYTTVANDWEELTFVFGPQTSGLYENLVFMFDFGTTGDGSANSTFLFDDVTFTYVSTLDQIDLPVTFDLTTVDYTVTDFGGNSTTLGQAPAKVGGNIVAITTKTAGAQTWAGTTMSTDAGFASAIPFADGSTKMSVKVYSPASGITIRLKVEDHNDGTKSVETEAVTTVANDWEVLEFDFSNEASGTAAINYSYTYDKASIFFDFGNTGDDAVYYWDDVTFVQTTSFGQIINNNTLSISPNPVQNIFNISGLNSISEFNVYTVSGQKVEIKRISDTSFDVSNLESGIYSISIKDANNNTYTSKFIKM